MERIVHAVKCNQASREPNPYGIACPGHGKSQPAGQ